MKNDILHRQNILKHKNKSFLPIKKQILLNHKKHKPFLQSFFTIEKSSENKHGIS